MQCLFQIGVRTEGIQEALLKMKDQNTHRVDTIKQIVQAVSFAFNVKLRIFSAAILSLRSLLSSSHSLLDGRPLLQTNHWSLSM